MLNKIMWTKITIEIQKRRKLLKPVIFREIFMKEILSSALVSGQYFDR